VEILLAFVSILSLIVGIAQLLRTPKPKPEPEPFTPTCVTIIGVPVDRGRDLFGPRR
jgi:hypothetical protein